MRFLAVPIPPLLYHFDTKQTDRLVYNLVWPTQYIVSGVMASSCDAISDITHFDKISHRQSNDPCGYFTDLSGIQKPAGNTY